MAIEKEFIELVDGRSMRVVVTLAVLQEIYDQAGKSAVQSIQSGRVDFNAVMTVFLVMIKHGEQLEKRELAVTGEELKRLLRIDQIHKMVEIINRDAPGFNSKSVQFRSKNTNSRYN